jgi:hypothetical protein
MEQINEAFTQEESSKIYDNFLAIVNDKKRRDRLVSKHGKNAEAVAYGTAVNQVKKQAANNITEPTTEEPMEDNKLKEMIKSALSKPLDEKKKSFPDLTGDGKITKADILKARGVELDEVNLGHNEISSIHQEGGSWIVSYRTMDGKKEKVFQSEDEARKFASTLNEDLDLGHEDDEPHMLKADLYRIGKYAMELYKMIDQFEGPQEVDFPHWWQAKIIGAKNMLISAKHYLDFELKEPQIDAMVDVASKEDVIDEEMTPEKSKKIGMPFKDVAEEGALNEKLKPSMGVDSYIKDFIKSEDPKFKGESKKERIKRAVAAFYQAKK